MDQRANSWLAFTLWCAVGAGLCVGVLSILTVGFAVLLVTLVVCAFLLWWAGVGPALTGIVAGAAAPVLWVAWLNRGGPGTVCSGTATSSSCTEEWTPWPFLVAAVLMVLAGVVAFLRLRRA